MIVPSVSEMFHGIEDEESGRTEEMQNEYMKKEELRFCFGIMSQQNEQLGQNTECAKSGRCWCRM
mgnify:CR=1 FL=1